jgi:hypothetical protein
MLAVLLACVYSVAKADDPKPAAPKKDYSDFSRLIHKMVVKELPKEFEDHSSWGQMVPLTEPVRFPNLPRTRIRVGDKEGYPHGLWKKFKGRIEDPAKDLKINVRELSKVDPKTYRLVLDSEVAVTGEGEVQNWQKGVSLGRLNASADAVVGLGMTFDVRVTFNTKKFPPDLIVEPKLTDLQIDLKEINLRRVVHPTTNIVVEGEALKKFGDDARGWLNSALKNLEPEIKKRANEAIAQSLKEGKGTISAAALFKSAPPAKSAPPKGK